MFFYTATSGGGKVSSRLSRWGESGVIMELNIEQLEIYIKVTILYEKSLKTAINLEITYLPFYGVLLNN